MRVRVMRPGGGVRQRWRQPSISDEYSASESIEAWFSLLPTTHAHAQECPSLSPLPTLRGAFSSSSVTVCRSYDLKQAALPTTWLGWMSVQAAVWLK